MPKMAFPAVLGSSPNFKAYCSPCIKYIPDNTPTVFVRVPAAADTTTSIAPVSYTHLTLPTTERV